MVNIPLYNIKNPLAYLRMQFPIFVGLYNVIHFREFVYYWIACIEEHKKY